MGEIGHKSQHLFERFLERMRALSRAPEHEEIYRFFEEEFQKQLRNPTQFGTYHERTKRYTDFGKKFIGIALDQKNSQVLGKERLKTIEEQIARGENVIFFANHQVEPDPQVLLILLGNLTGPWMDEMVFVAGDRVTRDPIAIPLSLGCNLLSIYSKKYIDTPKELKEQKLLHNKRTLKKLEELLTSGGKLVYVAPSGGRDRKNPDGSLFPAPFDTSSIELFILISTIAKTKTHFYPLALYTYPLLPPPPGIQIELGEERLPTISPCHISIGPELTEEYLHVETKDKEERRSKRCQKIYEAVLKEYLRICP